MIPVYAIVAIALAIGGISAYVSKEDDGFVEEVSENVIENQFNLPAGSIDLTPGSPEKE